MRQNLRTFSEISETESIVIQFIISSASLFLRCGMEDRRLMPSDGSLRTEDEQKGPPSKKEKDDMRKQRMKQGAPRPVLFNYKLAVLFANLLITE